MNHSRAGQSHTVCPATPVENGALAHQLELKDVIVDGRSRRQASAINRIELLLLSGEDVTVVPKLIERTAVKARSCLRKCSAVEPKHCDRFGMPLECVQNVIVEERT
jgi:hypothetical protein